MKNNHLTYTLLCAASSFVLTLGSMPEQSYAFVPTTIQITLRTAAQEGNQAFLARVQQLVNQFPNLADGIRQKAASMKPDLAAQILGNTAAPIPTTAPTPPSISLGNVSKPVRVATASAGTGVGTTAAVVTGVVVGTAGIAGAALALGGSGGGGSSSSSSSTDAWLTFGAAGSGYLVAPSTYEDTEYFNSDANDLINASSAYARGATGAGVRIAIVDSGIDTNHSEFDSGGRIDLADSQNLISAMGDSTNIEDPNTDGHGTHVAGIIGADNDGTGIQGVAYDAELVIYKVFNDDGATDISATNAEFTQAYYDAVTDSIDVVNGSYSYQTGTTPSTIVDESLADAIQSASDNGVIVVFSTGNDSEDNPQAPALLPYVSSSTLSSNLYLYSDSTVNDYTSIDTLIAVTSVDADGSISSFANRCGVAADWCLAAPGGLITSSVPDDTYAIYSGTSMSAPVVTGAVALLIDMFPSLTPEQIVERLFASANKSGIYADSSIYGQGLLDLEKATRPIGSLVVTTASSLGSGATYTAGTSSFMSSSSMGDAVRNSLSGVTIATFDDMGATFKINADAFIHASEDNFDALAELTAFATKKPTTMLELNDATSISYRIANSDAKFYNTKESPTEQQTPYKLQDAHLVHTLSDTSKVSFGVNLNLENTTSLLTPEQQQRKVLLGETSFSNPWISDYSDNYVLGYSQNLSETISLGTQNVFARNITEDQEEGSAFASEATLHWSPSKNTTLNLSAGLILESDSLLGAETKQGLATNGATTYYSGIQGKVGLTDNVALLGSYYYGVTKTDLATSSLLTDMSEIKSQSFTLGFMGDLPEQKSVWGLVANAPLAISSGTANFKFASSRDQSGAISYDTYSTNLSPTERELDFEAFLQHELSETETISTSVLHRINPANSSTTENETVFMLKYVTSF